MFDILMDARFTALTDEELEEYESIMTLANNSVVQKYGIAKRLLACLRPKEWLNDEVSNKFLFYKF